MSFGFGFGLARGITQGVIVPDPVLGLSFVGPGPLSPLVTFTRASGATVVGSDGYINNVTNDTPRFDYNPVDLSSRGLLIEQASTNLLLYAEQLSKPEWANVNASITSNAVDSPFLSTKADIITSTNSVTGYIQQNIIATGTNYSFSVFLKADTSSSANIQIYDATTGTALNTLNIPNISSGTPYAGGWYRHSVYTTTATNGNTIGFRIFPWGNIFTGGLNKSIAAFGAQVEVGDTFNSPSSYMRSFATAFARSADVAIITGTNFSSWFDAIKGTFYADGMIVRATPQAYSWMIEGSNGTTYATVTIGTGSTATRASVAVRMNTNAALNSNDNILTTYSANQVIKGAAAYDTTATPDSERSLLAFKGAIISPNSSQTATTADRLYIGSRAGVNNFFNGWIRNVRFYNSKLTAAQMQSITS